MRKGMFALAFCALAQCNENPLSSRSASFELYAEARSSLESGNFDAAIAKYHDILPDANPELKPRITLELAHALLRAGDHELSIETLRPIIHLLDGRRTDSAFQVVATALHEIALTKLSNGSNTQEVDKILDESLSYLSNSTQPLDEAMENRKQLIQATLTNQR